MRFPSKILLAALAVVILALAGWSVLTKYSSATFAGPEFHTLDAVDRSKVASDLSHHLEGLGFKAAGPPSAMDSSAGVQSQNGKRSWFVRKESNTRATWVAVDIDATRVAASVKWENRGTQKSQVVAEGRAYQFALELDDWFRARSEKNRLPSELAEKKREWFTEELERSAR